MPHAAGEQKTKSILFMSMILEEQYIKLMEAYPKLYLL